MTDPTPNETTNSVGAWRLALHSLQLPPGGDVKFEHGISVVLLREGKVTVADDQDDALAHHKMEAWVQRSPSILVDDGAPATINWWNLSRDEEPTTDVGTVLLASDVTIESTTRLLRCDQVAFPPGGVAYLHTHAGPGIRRLITGALRVETSGVSHVYGPGDAWFEAGPVPVFAEASDVTGASFVRVMVLPPEFKGKTSITYVREEDRLLPKDQRYTMYLDEVVTI